MTLSMSGLKSSALGLLALAVVPIAGCASQGGTQQPAPQPPADSAIKIDSPKDAKALPLCNLLSPQAAQSLGLKPQGEQEENSLNPGEPPMCRFESEGNDKLVLSMTVLDRNIAKDYLSAPQTWKDFSKLDVAGHPTVRANPDVPDKTGNCDLYLATQENQMVASQVTLPTTAPNKAESCQIAQKALEAAVPTLPPAK